MQDNNPQTEPSAYLKLIVDCHKKSFIRCAGVKVTVEKTSQIHLHPQQIRRALSCTPAGIIGYSEPQDHMWRLDRRRLRLKNWSLYEKIKKYISGRWASRTEASWARASSTLGSMTHRADLVCVTPVRADIWWMRRPSSARSSSELKPWMYVKRFMEDKWVVKQ